MAQFDLAKNTSPGGFFPICTIGRVNSPQPHGFRERVHHFYQRVPSQSEKSLRRSAFHASVNPLDQCHRSRIRGPLSKFDDAAITTLTSGVGGSDVLEQHLGAASSKLIAAQEGNGMAAGMEITAFAESHEPLRVGTERFGLGKGGGDLAMLNQAARKVAQE
jgi:hypothetical protein